jgi:hypothetical protein
VGQLRREVDRLRREAGGRAILLRDGTHFRYSREETAVALFMHATRCLHADYAGEPRPEAPAILCAVARAKDRRGALAQLYPLWPQSRPFTPYDLAALVETGELVPAEFNPDFPIAAGDD